MLSFVLSALILTGYLALALWFWFETRVYVRLSEQPAPKEPAAQPQLVRLAAAGHAESDLQALIEETVERRAGRTRQSTRWISILLPVVGGVLLAAAGGILNYNATTATTQTQLSTIEKHQEKQDSSIAANTQAMRDLLDRLPKEFKPRADIEHDEELVRRTREEDEDRFARRQALLHNEYTQRSARK